MNSLITSKVKNKIIREFIKDKDFLTAIDSATLTPKTPDKYIRTHIFDYHQNPYTLKNVETFITIQVHIPESRYLDKVFIKPEVEIWVISHEKHMKVDNIPNVNANRNDYISHLIDKKINGRNDFGIDDFNLISNIEGSYQADYVYRRLRFQGTDINNTLCNDV